VATVDGDERAQLILVAAIGLAVTLVALALILNSAIFTGNLASRNIESGASDALEARANVQDGLGGVMDGVNDPDSPTNYGTLETNYQSGLDEWIEQTTKYSALRGGSLRVSPIVENNGVQIVDRDGVNGFTPRGGTLVDWTVAPDVRARNFQLTVTDVSAAPSDSTVKDELDDGPWTEGTSFFYVDIDDGEWRMAIYGDGAGNVKVAVYDDDTGDFSVCSNTPAATPVRIDVGAGSVNGEPCNALTSVAKQVDLYTIHFANGDKVEGEYELTVDRVIDQPTADTGPFTDAVDAANYGNHCSGPTYAAADGGNSPYVAPALYSGDVEMHYRSQSIEYSSTVRIAAGELSEGASSPVIEQFSVNEPDSEADDGEFTVSWDTFDPDGDTVSVTIEITEPDNEVNSYSQSGSGSETFYVDAESGTYTVTIKASDGTNERSVTQMHQDDGDDSGCPA
jgi:hypothetical protein